MLCLALAPSAFSQDQGGNGGGFSLAAFSGLRLGPVKFHPRFNAGVTYDDNIYFTTKNPAADEIWSIQPAFQAVLGDDAALVPFRDLHIDVLALSPDYFIVRPPEDWPGKLLILDYGPRFQFFDRYTENNSIDQFATFNVLWPMNRLILGFDQGYQLQRTAIIETGTRTTQELIPTTLSAAYRFSDKTSADASLNRLDTTYDSPGLTSYTEYNNQDWFNYELFPDFPVSLGFLGGYDEVPNNQSQTFEQLRARARYYYTQKLTFDASAGGELRQFEGGTSDLLSPVFDVGAGYQAAPRTALSLSGYGREYATIVNGTYTTSTGVSLGVSQGVSERLTINFTGSYFLLDYTPFQNTSAAITDGYYEVRTGVQAKLVRHLTGELFYQWLNQQPEHAGGGFTENQVGVRLAWAW